MSYPISHVVVRDKQPPKRPVMTIGHIYPIVQNPEPEAVFTTIGRDDEDEKSFEDAETKVVKKRGRRPAVRASEVAETK